MYEMKIGMFGGGGCGKTEITLRYLKNEFTEGYTPCIDDEFSKVVEIDGKTVSLSIYDTAGQDDFAEMRFGYYSKVQASILVFDISNPHSIEDIKSIYEDMQNAVENNVIIALAANKGYLRDENRTDLVSVEEYKNLEKSFNCKVFETNAKTGKNIKEIFEYLIKQFLQSLNKESFPKDKNQKNSRIVLTSNIQTSSQDLLKKRSTSFVPKMAKSKKLDSIEGFGSDSSSYSSVFNSPMGAEIKTILQSRTKQLQVALAEKKELENKLQEKDAELQKAQDLIYELQKALSKYDESYVVTPLARPRRDRKNSIIPSQIDGDNFNLRRHSLKSNLSDDDDQNEFKNPRRKSDLNDDRSVPVRRGRSGSILKNASEDDTENDQNEQKKSSRIRSNSTKTDLDELAKEKSLYMKKNNLSDDDQDELKKEKQSLHRRNNMSDCMADEYKKSKRKSSRKSNLSDNQDETKKEKKKSSKKNSTSKNEGDQSKLTFEKLKSLAHPPNQSDIFTKKIRIFRPDEIDQLKKVKEIGRGSVDEVIKVTRKQVMAMIVFDFNKQNQDQDKTQGSISKMESLLHLYETLNQIKNPYILKALGICFGDEEHKPSMLFEYLPNSLKKMVKKLTNEEKIAVIYEVADALNQAHLQGISHLNLNPENILIDSENQAKVTDFGVSSLINFNSPEMIRQKFGSSFQFLAPEIFQCTKINDEKVDVYSLGIVIYYIIANGELPNVEINDQNKVKIDLSSFPGNFNEYASGLICKCCSMDPEERPSLADIVSNLEESFDLIDGVDISAIKTRLQI